MDEKNEQQRQLAQLIHLAEAQIDVALRDGALSIDRIGESFAVIADNVGKISATVSDAECNDTFQLQRAAIEQSVAESVMSFQFYDRLTQRMEHVREGLRAVASALEAGQLADDVVWKALMQETEQRFTMSSEAKVLQSVLQGGAVAQAVNSIADEENNEGDIELF